MGKGFRKRRRAALAAITGDGKIEKGPCFKDGCKAQGRALHECLSCIKLAEAGRLDGEPFKLLCCFGHDALGLKKVKRHALTAHPANLLRVVAAGLKGEKIDG